MRAIEPKATATCAVAQIFSYSFSRAAGIELLGIVEAARDALGVENDRGRRHRAGERSPARLVAAGDREDALVERAALAPEARAQLRLVERQALRARTLDCGFRRLYLGGPILMLGAGNTEVD